MTLTYKLKFFDYWHLGSGLSAGAKLDSTVTKDDKDIPYASGKTIKGLVREMAELLYTDSEFIKKCFGSEGVDNSKCYFKNATLDKDTRDEIISNKLQDKLYDTIAFTKVEDGIAADDSLREIEVTIPISLCGKILDIENKEDFKKLEKSLKMIKRMGLNRNRGLGRCEFKEIKCES
jgi:CRISPR/Cas system CSM-associated protein Csm3 (group 7 of RAMP superfamily)